ncbi:MAG: helix-turn-helix domain-containing protein [Oscillospiraceae bacterium]|nr:helix-turn-helix domain-containing protein [Oscillospiraceae bacterium]
MMYQTVQIDHQKGIKMLDKEKITAILQYGTLDNCRDLLHNYLAQSDFFSLESLMLRLYISMDVYIAAQNMSQSFGVSHGEFISYFGSIDDVANRMQTVETTTSFLYDLVVQCIRWRIESVTESSNHIISKAKQYIDTHYMDDDISLNRVADSVGLTPTYLSMLFKRETKQNFSDYLTIMRVTKAKELLCCTSKLISEIAYEVGFRDYRYFGQIFKKHTGMTPRQFQNSSNRLECLV